MIKILDHKSTPPRLVANFWWSSERGLTCDRTWLFSLLQKEGIVLPNLRIVHPSDGRDFFDALPFRFNGLWSAQPVVEVGLQGGESA